MAFYDSYYDSAQIEPPIPQSSYEPTFYNLFDYPPPCYFGQAYAPYTSNFNEFPQLIEHQPVDHGAYGYTISYSANACSASTFSVPKVIEYDPDLYSDGYQKMSSQFVISYSVSEFNETEFEEYDPTPYGGGYDIHETYEKTKPSSEIKPTQIEKDNTASESEEIEEVKAIPFADPGTGYGNGREVNQFPSGYGLEAMDLCESLFGYWPCLSRIKKQTACRQLNNGCGRCHGHCYCYGNYGNQWQTAADYLFGSHNPYPDGRCEGDGVYGYQTQYQTEPVYGYVWLNQNDFVRSDDA
ncbi:hypothetical protein SDJN02_18620 [Cucurbita argyrosperma subsp. argyrosperma]|nr:hypothetical protein SDJN02_18620 [Cucurbita argyrosperma subsp. argyrosperma]